MCLCKTELCRSFSKARQAFCLLYEMTWTFDWRHWGPQICVLVLKVIVWRNPPHNFFYLSTDVMFVVLNKRPVITVWKIDDKFDDRHQKQESTWLLTSPLTEANLWLVVPCFSLVSLWVWCYHQDLYLTASSLKWSPMIEKELLCSNFSMSFFS